MRAKAEKNLNLETKLCTECGVFTPSVLCVFDLHEESLRSTVKTFEARNLPICWFWTGISFRVEFESSLFNLERAEDKTISGIFIGLFGALSHIT